MDLKPDKYYQDLEGQGYFSKLDKRTKEYKEYKFWLGSKGIKNIDVSYENVVASVDKENTVGLGDVVETVAKVTGVKKVVESITDDCGCDERKKLFNKIPLWRRRKVRCIEKDDYIWVKGLIASNPSRFSFEVRERLVRVYNHVFRTNQKNSKCYPCIKGLIENLDSYLKVWEGGSDSNT